VFYPEDKKDRFAMNLSFYFIGRITPVAWHSPPSEGCQITDDGVV